MKTRTFAPLEARNIGFDEMRRVFCLPWYKYLQRVYVSY
jgi:hypothetical protein